MINAQYPQGVKQGADGSENFVQGTFPPGVGGTAVFTEIARDHASAHGWSPVADIYRCKERQKRLLAMIKLMAEIEAFFQLVSGNFSI